MVDVGVTDAPFGGGSSDNFFEAMYPWPDRITAVGHTELDRFAAAFPQVRAVRADGRDLPFSDGAFDLGFSNAVVEHVAGGRDGQRRFVHELCRVARRVFVTTPNRWFPLEVHTLLPFVHWLPASARARVIPVRRRARPARAEGVRVALSLPGACTESRHDARRRRPRMTWRRPVWALYALVVGLALHNIVMAMLWRAGVRGGASTAISAWKEVLLLAALVLVVAERRALPFSRSSLPDVLALAFALFVVVYALIPQSVLGGGATHKGVALRASPRPADRRRLLPRPRAPADRQGAGTALSGRARDGRVRRGVRAGRRLRGPALVVAAVGRLVPAPARPRLRARPFPPAPELRLQRGRERGVPSAHVHVPLPACDRLLCSWWRCSSSHSGAAGDFRSAHCCSPRSCGRTRALR